MSEGQGVITAIILAMAVVFGFLIFRQIVLWYWKINEIVERLDGILAELKKANKAPEA
jgi:hypothetical protein